MTQVLELHELPIDIRAHFLAMPEFNKAMQITKSASLDTGTPAQVVKTLKTSRIIPREEKVLKAVNTPNFALILAGASPVKKTAPTPATPTSISPAPAKTLPATHNTPKAPIPAKGSPVEYATLQAAIDSALNARRDQEKREAFERGRSAFARLAPARESDAPRGGMGDAWSLRNASGKLVQSVLGGVTRKADQKPVGSSALDVAFGRGR